MSKLKGLLLTEGMHGMISQVEGLAKALDIDYTHQKVEINMFAKLFPPKITPISNLFFKKFTVPEIDLIISSGYSKSRAFANPSAWLTIPCNPSVNNKPFNLDINYYIALI